MRTVVVKAAHKSSHEEGEVMAAGFLSLPGTQFGPCEDGCNHSDCACTRQMANTTCSYCNKKIGYDKRFYDLRERGLLHAVCAEESRD
jgi:hypothetical protein